MLDPTESATVASAFGVAEAQVERDHLISHVLHALAAVDAPVVFFGGTALARTHLAANERGGRLSEDIDLWCADRSRTAALLDTSLLRQLRREFPRSRWEPSLTQTRRSIDPANPRFIRRNEAGRLGRPARCA